jgi:hypothetical protein
MCNHYCGDRYENLSCGKIWEIIVVAQNDPIEEEQEKKRTNYTEKV